MSEHYKEPDSIDNVNLNVGGNSIQLSAGALKALSGANALTDMSPVKDVEELLNESRGNLVEMMVGGVIDRKKSRIQRRNLAEKRRLLDERASCYRAAGNVLKAKDELINAMFACGSLTELQRTVLSLQYPGIAEEVELNKQLKNARITADLEKERARLIRYKGVTERKSPKEEYEEKLERQREEAVMGFEHSVVASSQILGIARQMRKQIATGDYSPEEQDFLEQKIKQLLAQHYLDEPNG